MVTSTELVSESEMSPDSAMWEPLIGLPDGFPQDPIPHTNQSASP